MGQLQTYIDPNTTSLILNELGLAIEETKIVKSIDSLTNLLRHIEDAGMRSTRIQFLKNEIELLNIRLNTVREQAEIKMLYS